MNGNVMKPKRAGERRGRDRRYVDGRIRRLLSGRCGAPVWSIATGGMTQVRVPCGKCLPCRLRAKLGPGLADEVLKHLERSGERRRCSERRRRQANIGSNRRRLFRDRRHPI